MTVLKRSVHTESFHILKKREEKLCPTSDSFQSIGKRALTRNE